MTVCSLSFPISEYGFLKLCHWKRKIKYWPLLRMYITRIAVQCINTPISPHSPTYGGSGLTDQDDVDVTCMVALSLNNTEGDAFSFRSGTQTIVETNGIGKARITLVNSTLEVEPSVMISSISDAIGIESLDLSLYLKLNLLPINSIRKPFRFEC